MATPSAGERSRLSPEIQAAPTKGDQSAVSICYEQLAIRTSPTQDAQDGWRSNPFSVRSIPIVPLGQRSFIDDVAAPYSLWRRNGHQS
jgi:hypothetical protein